MVHKMRRERLVGIMESSQLKIAGEEQFKPLALCPWVDNLSYSELKFLHL